MSRMLTGGRSISRRTLMYTLNSTMECDEDELIRELAELLQKLKEMEADND